MARGYTSPLRCSSETGWPVLDVHLPFASQLASIDLATDNDASDRSRLSVLPSKSNTRDPGDVSGLGSRPDVPRQTHTSHLSTAKWSPSTYLDPSRSVTTKCAQVRDPTMTSPAAGIEALLAAAAAASQNGEIPIDPLLSVSALTYCVGATDSVGLARAVTRFVLCPHVAAPESDLCQLAARLSAQLGRAEPVRPLRSPPL